MPSSHRRFLVFLSALGTLSAFDAVADTPTWTSTRIGLYGPEYTATAWNSQYTAVEYLNEAGHAAGYSARYFDTYQSQGQDAWVYNGTTTVQVGLTGTEYQSPINGYQYSAVLSLNAAGQAAGITRLQPVSMGQATWVYNGTSTVRVGLYGADFTRSDGYQYSQLNFFNALGQAAGTSSAYLQSPNGASGAPGEYAWFYDGVETIRIGLTDEAHSPPFGTHSSSIARLSDSGMVAGYTKRDSQGRDAWVYRNGVTTQIGLPLQPSDAHHSTIVALNQADMVAGYTTHQNGEDAWLYDGSTTIRLGLTGAEYISSAGVESSRVHALNDSGNASGTTVRYNSGTKVLGTAAWFYDGSQTIRIGLTDAAHTRDDGYQASLTSRMSKQGNYVAGGSYRYSGNVQIGEDAWLYDGISTVQIGLAGGDLTDASGFQRNVITDINEHGQAIGNSVVVAPVSAIGRSAAWFYDGNETRRLGLTDAMHTGRDGARDSTATLLNEQGQVAGISERFNGRYIPFANDENDSSPWLGMSAWLYDSSLDQIFDLTLSVRQGDKYAYSQVFYLGEDGMVLGEYELFDSNDASLGYRAFYFSTADGLWDLGLLVPGLDVEGWSHLASALKANGLGHIVGTGAIEGKNGQAAYLLTPNAVPLPASAWLLGSALFGLGLTARRSRCAS